jgi:elongation factor P
VDLGYPLPILDSGSDGTVDTSDFKNGLRIELGGDPYTIIYFQHVKPGKGGAFVRTKVKNLRNGKIVEKTFRAGEKVNPADVEDRTMQYLYHDGDSFVFMDSESYDQIPFSEEQIGDSKKYLQESLEVDVLFWIGDSKKYLQESLEVDVLFWKNNPINIELPSFIVAQVTRCDPGIKGDTAQGATKPATVETGAVVQVPLFIKEGEKIRVDTRSGEYVERVG